MAELDRRRALAMGAGALGAGLLAPAPAHAASWTLKWNPDPAKDGLGAFEGLEDDRAGSHPGVKHIYVADGAYRFDMHTQDRDGSDRQRNEAKGMRSGGTTLKINKDTTWRIAYQAYWPSTLTATTKFTHIMQMKVQDVGGPLWTLTPRQKSTPRLTVLTLRDDDSNIEHDLTGYTALQDKWIDLEFEFRASNSGGYLRVVIRNGGTTVVDYRTTNVDLWRDKNYLRPKWGIYRSIESAGLKNTYQLIRGYKAYQFV
ncbi:Tat pathway signal sequence domain protein [Amycolatopsis lurida]